VVFGQVVSGKEVVSQIEMLPVDRNSRPLQDARVSKCGELVLLTKSKDKKKKAKKEESASSSSSSSESPENSEESGSEGEAEKKKKNIQTVEAIPEKELNFVPPPFTAFSKIQWEENRLHTIIGNSLLCKYFTQYLSIYSPSVQEIFKLYKILKCL